MRPTAFFKSLSGQLERVRTGKPFFLFAEMARTARIARYYATQSLLVLDPDTGTYDAEATPEFGSDTLAEHYAQLFERSGVKRLLDVSYFALCL